MYAVHSCSLLRTGHYVQALEAEVTEKEQKALRRLRRASSQLTPLATAAAVAAVEAEREAERAQAGDDEASTGAGAGAGAAEEAEGEATDESKPRKWSAASDDAARAELRDQM